MFYSNGCAAFGSFPNYDIFLVVASIVLNVIMHPCIHQIIAIIPDHLGKPHDRLASEDVLLVIHGVLER